MRIAVLGAGSFGTALAMQLARQGHDTALWGRDSETLKSDAKAGCNQRYLPGLDFPEGLTLQPDIQKALNSSMLWVLAAPSHALRPLLKQCRDTYEQAKEKPTLVLACKGLDNGQLPTQIVAEEYGENAACAVLSGPTFAKEIARNAPTAVTIAAHDEALAQQVATAFHGGMFRVYSSPDPIGVAVGGALKNPLAIAAGIADGLNFGPNTRAALITRGLAEMQRLGAALGAQSETFMGLAGLGDLVLTCTDDQSRNRRTGLALAAGKSKNEAVAEIGQVVEGITAAKEIWHLAAKLNVEMPINEQVYQMLHNDLDPTAAVMALLSRAPKSEAED